MLLYRKAQSIELERRRNKQNKHMASVRSCEIFINIRFGHSLMESQNNRIDQPKPPKHIVNIFISSPFAISLQFRPNFYYRMGMNEPYLGLLSDY